MVEDNTANFGALNIPSRTYNATSSVGRVVPDTGVTPVSLGLVRLANSRNHRFGTIQLSIKLCSSR